MNSEAEQAKDHASDCALHNAPAFEPSPCDCGAEQTPIQRELASRLDGVFKAHDYREVSRAPVKGVVGDGNPGF